jgi:hypothetical protein
MLITPFDKMKDVVDDVLKRVNSEPYQKPQETDFQLFIENSVGVLQDYFFNELENPEVVYLLKEKGLLSYYQTTDEDKNNIMYEYAYPYLLKIADKKPDEVFDLINPFWNDLKQDERLIYFLHNIFEIGIVISKAKKNIYFLWQKCS